MYKLRLFVILNFILTALLAFSQEKLVEKSINMELKKKND